MLVRTGIATEAGAATVQELTLTNVRLVEAQKSLTELGEAVIVPDLPVRKQTNKRASNPRLLGRRTDCWPTRPAILPATHLPGLVGDAGIAARAGSLTSGYRIIQRRRRCPRRARQCRDRRIAPAHEHAVGAETDRLLGLAMHTHAPVVSAVRTAASLVR